MAPEGELEGHRATLKNIEVMCWSKLHGARPVGDSKLLIQGFFKSPITKQLSMKHIV